MPQTSRANATIAFSGKGLKRAAVWAKGIAIIWFLLRASPRANVMVARMAKITSALVGVRKDL